jgi:hypothetical protein
MSLCSHTVRAISRSRGQSPRTLLPFLYQTATIQQWKPATRPITRRNISSRTRAAPTEDVPFVDEDGYLPPTIEEAQARRTTTITGTERAAFEKLYRTFNTQGQGKKKGDGGEHEELDQVADEYYEDDEEPSKSLDKVFEEALQGGLPRPQQQYTRVPRTKATETSGTGKAASTTQAETPLQKRRLAAKAEKDRVRKLRLAERERIDLLLKSAQTDRELWEILTQQVFSRLTKLDLDAPVPPKKDRTKPLPGSKPVRGTSREKKPTPDPSIDTRILFPNYPHHLLTALQTLRVHFPSSPLALALLPAIRNLGRASYALGATSQLYKHLLRTAWLQQSSYTLIDTLLSDMQTNMIEFDMGILEVLDGVMREHDLALSGRLGTDLQMVVGLESWVEGFEKVKNWRSVVAAKVGVVEQRPAERIVRKVDNRRHEERNDEHREGVMGTRQTQWMDSRRDEFGRAPPVIMRSIRRTAGGDAIPFAGKEMGFEMTNVEAEDIDAESSAFALDDVDELEQEEAGGRVKVLL